MVNPARNSDVEVVLNPGGTVEGTVIQDGVPIVDAWVYIGMEDYSYTNPAIRMVRTNDVGHFRIDHVSPGERILRTKIRGDGFFSREVTRYLSIQEGETTRMDLNIASGTAAIQASILTAGLPPIRNNFYVHLEVDGPEGYGYCLLLLRDNDTIRGGNIPAGTATLDIRFTLEDDGIEQHRYLTVELPPGETTELAIDLTP